jgi:hypothetical protein
MVRLEAVGRRFSTAEGEPEGCLLEKLAVAAVRRHELEPAAADVCLEER